MPATMFTARLKPHLELGDRLQNLDNGADAHTQVGFVLAIRWRRARFRDAVGVGTLLPDSAAVQRDHLQ